MEMLKKTLRDSKTARWIVLLLVSLVLAVNYFFYDVLSPIQSKLLDSLKFTNSQYGFLVSAYSVPNVFLFMTVIGGIVLDKLGIRISGLFFISSMFLGAVITAYGASDAFNSGGFGYNFMNSFMVNFSPSLKLMTIGFFLFGLGAETTGVIVTKVVVKWFKGKELAFALGLNISVARGGTLLAFLLSVPLSKLSPWYRPIWLGALFLGVGLLLFMVYMIMDIKIDKQTKNEVLTEPEEEFRLSDIGKIIRIPSFIYITLLCVTFYSAVFPFLKYATNMLENKFGFSAEFSSFITSILPFGTMIFTPLFGLYTDYKGKSASIMIFGSLLLVVSHLLFTFTNITPFVPMFILGIAFSLVPAAMWPSVSKIIETSKIGTAYGLMFWVQNVGLWAFPILIGIVLDATNPGVTPEKVTNHEAVYNYTYPILMLVFLGLLGIVFALLLKREDKRSGFGLELPNNI